MSLVKHFLDVKSMRTPKWSDAKGDKFVFSYDASGVSQVWEHTLETNQDKQLSTFDNFVVGIQTHPSSARTAFSMSDSGNERFQIFLHENGEIHNLTQNPDAGHYLGPFSNDGRFLYYTANDRDFAHFDIHHYDFTTQTSTCLLENNDNYNFPETVSPDNKYFVYRKLKSEDDQPLWILDIATGKAEVMTSQTGKFGTATWVPDSSGFYFMSNVDAEFSYCAFYDVASKTTRKVYEAAWDIETIALTHDGKYLAFVINEDGASNLVIYDTDANRVVNTPQPPQGEIAYYDTIAWAPNDYRLLFTLSSGTRAPNVWLLDLDEECLMRVTRNVISEEIVDGCVDATLHRYTSFDGLSVPYWLYVPRGMTLKDMPVMIEIHGGPEGQEKASYNEMIQYVVSQNIAVVAPNVRGSTGYGKTYTHLDDVDKRLDSVKDIESLVLHLIDVGLADKNKIAVSGTSYGGFMTLSCAARYPDLFCGAIDNVGMYNLVTFLENTASYRRAHRESEYGSLEKHRDILFNVSPVAKVDDVKGPLMVIHGANDPRVPISEAEQVVTYLKAKNVPVTYLRYEDEGHGLHKYENKQHCYTEMIAFLKDCMNI